MADNNNYKQISVSKTSKALVEFCDNIRFQHQYAWPFDRGARILCRMNDYSLGKGEKLITVSHNLLLTDIKKIKSKIEAIENTNLMLSVTNRKITEKVTIFTEDKILNFDAYKNEQNPEQRKFTQINISYNPTMNNPYCIIVSNGWGIPEETSTGGTKVKKDSMKITNTVKMFLTYDGIFTLFERVDMFIDAVMTVGVEKYLKTLEQNK